MGRVVAVVLLSLSLTAFAQTTSQPASSQQTSTIPARVNLEPASPVYSATTPMGVVPPPPSPGETPVVWQEYRVATPLVPSGPPSDAISPDTTPANAELNVTSSRTGVVGYAVASEPSGPAISVADAAAQYKSGKANMKSRVIDNNSLATLDNNPSGLVTATELTMPQADITPEDAAELDRAKPEHAAAGDTLDPRDLAAVEAAVRRSQMQVDDASATEPTSQAAASSPDAAAQYEQMDREAEAQQPAATPSEPAAQPQASPAEQQPRERLPESSSALPLLGLMGALAVGGGALSVWRSRG